MEKVSVIVPTLNNRKDLLKYILLSYRAQDYRNKEIIIGGIDSAFSFNTLQHDSCDAIYKDINERVSIGSKRNQLIELARGDIILHMDDDDYYAPDWITRSIAALGSHQMTGLSSLYFYKPDTNLWLYEYPMHEKPWVAGATMCYRKSFWEKHPFDENIKYGEDNKFVWACEDVAPHNYTNGFLASIHPNNTSPKLTTDPAWRSLPVSHVKNILKDDYEKYLSLFSTEAVKP